MEQACRTVSVIKQYQLSQDTALLDKIIEENTGLVRSVAAKFSYCGESHDDLVQCGYIGLINAINCFDEKRGTQFSTYATRMIDGEIRHYLRDNQLLKIPRWVRALSSQIDKSVDKLMKKLGRLPKISEIAYDLNITKEGIMEVLKARDASALSPQCIKRQEHRSFQLPVEDKILLYEAMDALSLLEKKVVYFVFYKDLTEGEVGQHLEIGQRKVSRVLAKALSKLRDVLAEEL